MSGGLSASRCKNVLHVRRIVVAQHRFAPASGKVAIVEICNAVADDRFHVQRGTSAFTAVGQGRMHAETAQRGDRCGVLAMQRSGSIAERAPFEAHRNARTAPSRLLERRKETSERR